MKLLRTMAALCAAWTLLFVTPAVADETTVGRFVMELARTKQLASADVTTAVVALDGIGIRVPAETDFSKRLTERDVVRLSRLAGLNVTTTRPDNSFDGERVDLFFTTFENELDPPSTSARSAITS